MSTAFTADPAPKPQPIHKTFRCPVCKREGSLTVPVYSLDTGMLYAEDAVVPLPLAAGRIINVLARASPDPVRTTDLVEALWSTENEPDYAENTIRVYIRFARIALTPTSWRIKSRRNIGYSLYREEPADG